MRKNGSDISKFLLKKGVMSALLRFVRPERSRRRFARRERERRLAATAHSAAA